MSFEIDILIIEGVKIMIKWRTLIFRNSPNIVTASRIVVAIWIALEIIFDHSKINFFIRGCFYVGLSDLIDGLIAKWFKLESKFGAMLDTVADKFVIFLLIPLILWIFCLRVEPSLLKSLTGMLFVRVFVFELVIAVISLISAASYGREIKSNEAGRKKFLFLCFAVGILLMSLFINENYGIVVFDWALPIAIGCLLVTSILQMVSIVNFWKTIR